jgi:drug/metabolite transporter (DMT)-like permease
MEAKISVTDNTPMGRVYGALVVGVIAISFAASFFLKASPTHPVAAAGVRLAIACGLLSPLLIRAWIRGQLSKRLLTHGLGAGLCYGVHFSAWVGSLEQTSVTASVTLVTATPLLLAIWSLITGKDRPQLRIWIAIGLALVGVTIIGWNDATGATGSLLGAGLALIGAMGMAAYFLIARNYGPKLDIWVFAAIATGTGAIALLITAIIIGIPFEAATDEAFFYLFLAALFPQLVGHTALTWALRFKTPTIVGIATVGEPVIATLIAWLWLDKTVPGLAAIGCTVTLAAVLLALYEKRERSS